MLEKDTFKKDTTLGENWTVLVIKIINKSETRYLLDKLFQIIPDIYLSHYTIRSAWDGDFFVSFRALANASEFTREVEPLIMDNIPDEFVIELNPFDSLYHCWIKPGEEDERRTLANCIQLNLLSRVASTCFNDVNLLHIFANMMALREIAIEYPEGAKSGFYNLVNDKMSVDSDSFCMFPGETMDELFERLAEVMEEDG